MSDFSKLLDRCKATVHVTINDHKTVYQTAEYFIENDIMTLECPPKIDADIIKGMIENDSIVEIQFYPDTPIGFYSVYHYDFDECAKLAWECISNDPNTNQTS